METLIESVKTGLLLLKSRYSPFRDRVCPANMNFRLPFASDNGSGLGIAVKTYLDAVNEEEEITEALKATIKSQEGKYNWFQMLKGGNLSKSLDQAWKFWDAVRRGASLMRRPNANSLQIYAASQFPGTEVKEAKLFSEANEWLTARR